MLKGILLGIILGFVLVGVGGYLYFVSGRVPVATNSPEMPFERKFAQLALHAYLDKLPHPNPPVPADEANLLAGAKVYKENCAVCHGLPGEPHNAIGNGMFPRPPLLFRGMGVTVALRPFKTVPWEVLGVVAIKLLVHPLAAIGLMWLFGPFAQPWAATAVLMASLPPALNVFVIARQNDTWIEPASVAVLIGTFTSVLTLTSAMWLLQTGRLAFP